MFIFFIIDFLTEITLNINNFTAQFCQNTRFFFTAKAINSGEAGRNTGFCHKQRSNC